MRAPSLYSYFGQAWTEYLAVIDAAAPTLPRSPRAGLKKIAHTFFDYAVADLARHQLMNQRTIPGFVPSPTGQPPNLTADSDGVLVADVVNEWTARHGLDAISFCRTLSGREPAADLLTTEVLF